MYGIFTKSSHEISTTCRYTIHGSYGFVAKQGSIVFSFRPQQLETKFRNLKFWKFGLWYKRSQQRIVPMSHPMICKWLIAMVSFCPLRIGLSDPPSKWPNSMACFPGGDPITTDFKAKAQQAKARVQPRWLLPQVAKTDSHFFVPRIFQKRHTQRKNSQTAFFGLDCFVFVACFFWDRSSRL